MPLLHHSEELIDVNAVVEEGLDVGALGHLATALDSVIVEAVSIGAFVGEAGKLVVGLRGRGCTLYSSNLKGTLLAFLRWFSGRSLRWRWDLL